MGCLPEPACCKRRERELTEADKGVIMDRGCTDVLCLLIFIIFWFGMFAVAGIGAANGDPMRLIYASDYNGNTCGDSADPTTTDKFRIVYPRTNEDLLMNMKGGSLTGVDPLNFKFYGICVTDCPKALDVVCNYGQDMHAGATLTQAQMKSCFNGGNGAWCTQVNDQCWVTPQKTSSVFYRCLPEYTVYKKGSATCTFPENLSPNDPGCIVVNVTDENTVLKPAQPNILFDKINSARSLWGRYFGDLYTASWVLFVCGVVLAAVLGFIWLRVLMVCAGPMIWCSILLAFVAMFAVTLFLYFKAGIIDSATATNLIETATAGSSVAQTLDSASVGSKDAYKWAAYGATAFSIVMLCLLVALRQRIADTIRIVKKAAKALGATPTMVLYPLVTVVMLLLLLLYWSTVAAAVYSAGSISNVDVLADVTANLKSFANQTSWTQTFNLTRLESQPQLKEVKPMDIAQYLLAYHFFGLLWTNQVIQAIGMMTVSGVVASWYFKQNVEMSEEDKAAEPRFPVWESWKRTMRYHMGSIAFGGFLIAFIQFLRAILEYIDQQMKKQGEQTRLVKILMCALKCCMWCFQKCMEVITRNAFIYIAIKGWGFCRAAKEVIKLVLSNMGLMATVNTIGALLMFLGKFVITVFCGFIAWGILDGSSFEGKLESTWLPVLISMLFAYFTASGFFYIFDIAMDTILICFVTDKKENGGNARHMEEGELFNPKKVAAARAAEEEGQI